MWDDINKASRAYCTADSNLATAWLSLDVTLSYKNHRCLAMAFAPCAKKVITCSGKWDISQKGKEKQDFFPHSCFSFFSHWQSSTDLWLSAHPHLMFHLFLAVCGKSLAHFIFIIHYKTAPPPLAVRLFKWDIREAHFLARYGRLYSLSNHKDWQH